MKWFPGVLLGPALVMLFSGCCSNAADRPEAGARGGRRGDSYLSDRTTYPEDASQVKPLESGRKAPVASVRRIDGRLVNLADRYAEKPTVLIFYRGGWCPYCNVHLGQIATVEPTLLKMGFQVLAISPDRPEELAKTVDKQKLNYELLSDSDAKLARRFGLVFRVDDATVDKYRGFGIDLEKSSGRDHHLLPVPAVYIVDTSGVIRFAHWNPDYKKRLDSKVLVERAREIVDR